MSLSSVFSVLLVLPSVAMGLNFSEDGVIRDTMNLVSKLKDLIAMTYWIPSVATDGIEAYELVRSEEGRPYHSFLQGLAERYVTNVDTFCTSQPHFSAGLDKPNLHRLLELYQHSIPAFGHVSLFQELVFETAHQPLKRSVARGNHKNAEASAVYHCLGNDWQARLGMLYGRLHTGGAEECQAAFNGLRKILIGEDTGGMSNIRGEVWDEKRESLNKQIENCFTAPLLKAIRSEGIVNHALVGGPMQWVTEYKGDLPLPDNNDTSTAYLTELMESVQKNLFLRTGMFSKQIGDIRIWCRAKRIIPASTVGESLIWSQDVLEPGTVIQTVVKRGDETSILLRPQTNGDGVMLIFMVIGFLENDDDKPWLAAVRCRKSGRDTITIPKVPGQRSVQLVILNESPRRIALYHSCRDQGTCKIDHKS